MADFAHDVIFNLDDNRLQLDGAEFPWFYTEAAPVLEKHGDDLVPGIRLTILCSDMTSVSVKRATDG